MSQQGTIGIIGGGQLGRMLTEAAMKLGFKVIVVDPNENCSAKQVGADQILADFYDAAAIRTLAQKSDYLTIESEHVNVNALEELGKSGKPVNPKPGTVEMIQDKYRQKVFLQKAGIPTADSVEITDEASARQALQGFGDKMLLKSRLGAYDGRGNAVISRQEDIVPATEALGDKLYAEKFVTFQKELAVMVARDSGSSIVTYPVTQSVHERNICVETFTPADIDPKVAEQAVKVAIEATEHLEGSGVFGIEMFLTDEDKILVNEIAPRVHNSGHYTIEACETSQFEQHIRAITGMPLGSTDMKVPAAVMVNILGKRDGPTEIKGLEEASAVPGVTVHLYGKSPTKIDRKMGHITAIGDTLKQARERAEQARQLIDV